MQSIVKKMLSRAYLTSRRGLYPEMEAVYQNVFQRDLKSLNIDDDFYPFGWAANYGLMYLLLRICKTLNPKIIVEIGAGQTTLLLTKLVRAGTLKAMLHTVEHNLDWISFTNDKIDHNIIHKEITQINKDNISYKGFDFKEFEVTGISLLIIDGPPAGVGAIDYSRHGALDLVSNLDKDGFVIIIDDAERTGEALLSKRFQHRLRQIGIDFQVGSIDSNKKQIIIAGGNLVSAVFY